jgi:hypothetical protein
VHQISHHRKGREPFVPGKKTKEKKHLTIIKLEKCTHFRFRAPVSQAVVHHFRSCKKSNDWEDDVDATCQNMGNYYEDKYVAKILAPLENKIIKLKSSISNKT